MERGPFCMLIPPLVHPEDFLFCHIMVIGKLCFPPHSLSYGMGTRHQCGVTSSFSSIYLRSPPFFLAQSSKQTSFPFPHLFHRGTPVFLLLQCLDPLPVSETELPYVLCMPAVVLFESTSEGSHILESWQRKRNDPVNQFQKGNITSQ